jgi:hypothetical protein
MISHFKNETIKDILKELDDLKKIYLKSDKFDRINLDNRSKELRKKLLKLRNENL